MARRRRNEKRGAHYHVMNRGVARRTIFDTSADYRFFLAGLACAVRRREVEVFSYALMRTHFHLYLRSLGGLSDAMRRIQQRHARRFNRLHRRDGPLLRNRFLSRRVREGIHARNVVYYVHENPVLARICQQPGDYEWSSAGQWARGRRPPWLAGREIRRYGLAAGRIPTTSRTVMLARADLVEARLGAPGTLDDAPLDASAPERVLAWMRRKAQLADGYICRLPEVGPRTLIRVVKTEFATATRPPTGVPGAGTYDTLELLLAGLLRHVACSSYPEIAGVLQVDLMKARRLVGLHAKCLDALEDYARLAAAIVARCADLLEPADAGSPGTDRSQM